MKVVTTVRELRECIAAERRQGRTIGFVPTMGFLHEGHLSLTRESVKETDFTVVSIFVNPTQFGPNMDLDRYPRDFAGDCAKLESCRADLVFAPQANEVYPGGFGTWIEVDRLPNLLDGASRPGYFRGICTVVLKLFNMVVPDRTYFGQKDMQQALVLRKMIADLNLPLALVIMPIVREADGLAMSSRNSYLKGEARTVAPELFKALKLAQAAFEQGTRTRSELVALVKEQLARFPEFAIDYVEVVDLTELQLLEQIDSCALLALAVNLQGTRLIDNIILGDFSLR